MTGAYTHQYRGRPTAAYAATEERPMYEQPDDTRDRGPGLLDRLEKMIADLDQAAGNLEARISPILGSPGPQPAVTEDREPRNVGLTLEDQLERLQIRITQVREITDRVRL